MGFELVLLMDTIVVNIFRPKDVAIMHFLSFNSNFTDPYIKWGNQKTPNRKSYHYVSIAYEDFPTVWFTTNYK